MKQFMNASMAAAIGARLCRPGVISMYPITPQVHIVEDLAQFVNNGEMKAEIIRAESEQSVISSMIGAQAAGSRTFSATSSQGLAYMNEMLYIASGLRLPTVMVIANRALSAPINIWADHQDSFGARDAGWIQFYVEDSQETMDRVIQAYRVAEKVGLPAMVCLDGYQVSHVYEPVENIGQGMVDKFLPGYRPKYRLDWKKPVTFGPVGAPNSFMDFKNQQHKAMDDALKAIKEVNLEFGKVFGRKYGDGLVEAHDQDAKVGIIAMGSITGTIGDVLSRTQSKIGLLKLKTFRPFPVNEIKRAVKNWNYVAVIDRDISLGFGGALFGEIKSILPDKKVSSFIVGLGGRDVTEKSIKFVLKNMRKEREMWVDLNDNGTA